MCRCEIHAPPGFLLSGYRQNEERWICPNCKQVWEHVCDEGEGCLWVCVEGKEVRKRLHIWKKVPNA